MVSSRRKPSSASARRAGKTIDPGSGKITLADYVDIAARILLGLFFAFAAGIYFTNAYTQLRMAEGQPLLTRSVDVLSILATGVFMFFIACLYAIRLEPVNKFAGPVPAITAVLGAFLMWALLFLEPRTDLSPGLRIFAAWLILTSNILAIFILRYLGRSFSILPQGRQLITKGPYRYVRHPLYLVEAIATLGAMINFLSPAAVGLVVAQFLLQFARMHYEEKVLRTTFPAYEAYSRRTARLIPGIY